MTYRALDNESVIEYIKSRPKVWGTIFDTDAELDVKEVGDGNLNLVFIITNRKNPEQSVVLKQALPYLRVAGESWPLTRERMRYETKALLKHNELAPGLVPEVYDYDFDMSLVIMEDLSDLVIMRKALVARQKLPHFVDHISTFLARTLFFTSDLYLKGMEKKRMMAEFINEELRKLQEDFVYTNPYMESPENNWNPLVDDEVQAVRSDAALKLEIAEMKNAYMNHTEALIHADLHTGSIMVDAERTKVIDPEFAFFGPIAYDVGAVLQNLVLNYLSHYGHTPDPEERHEYQEYVLDMIRGVWNEFARKFEEIWVENNRGELVPTPYWDFPNGEEAFAEYRRRFIHRLLRETAGHGGVKFLRRMMGIVSVWDITSIEDPRKRAVAERAAIRIGKRWIMERKNVNSIDDLINIVREESIPAEKELEEITGND